MPTSKASRRSSKQETYVDEKTYLQWQSDVIEKLKSKKTLSDKKIYLLQKLSIVLDGQPAQWETNATNNKGFLFDMYNFKFGKASTYLHRQPYKRRSTQFQQYVACDLRGVKHHTVLNENPQWIQSDNEYTFNKSSFMKQGKQITGNEFVKAILNSFFKIQKSNAKSLKADNNPSKDNEISTHVLNWLTGIQNIMNEDVIHIRFAYAHFNADSNPKRTEPLRMYVPASSVRKTMKAYYTKERHPTTKKLVIRKCKGSECDSRYTAIDVNDEKEILDDSFLSINEPSLVLKYQAIEQK